MSSLSVLKWLAAIIWFVGSLVWALGGLNYPNPSDIIVSGIGVIILALCLARSYPMR